MDILYSFVVSGPSSRYNQNAMNVCTSYSGSGYCTGLFYSCLSLFDGTLYVVYSTLDHDRDIFLEMASSYSVPPVSVSVPVPSNFLIVLSLASSSSFVDSSSSSLICCSASCTLTISSTGIPSRNFTLPYPRVMLYLFTRW